MVRRWAGVRPFIPLGKTAQQAAASSKPPIKIGPRAVAWFEEDLLEAQKVFERERGE
jgi:hypothetical protein